MKGVTRYFENEIIRKKVISNCRNVQESNTESFKEGNPA